jgi:hypothetical protein
VVSKVESVEKKFPGMSRPRSALCYRRLMRPLKFFVLVVLAVLITVQPVVHHHSLTAANTAPSCSVCAFGAHAAVHAPAIVAPLGISHDYLTVVESTDSLAAPRVVSSRGPPAA